MKKPLPVLCKNSDTRQPRYSLALLRETRVEEEKEEEKGEEKSVMCETGEPGSFPLAKDVLRVQKGKGDIHHFQDD